MSPTLGPLREVQESSWHMLQVVQSLLGQWAVGNTRLDLLCGTWHCGPAHTVWGRQLERVFPGDVAQALHAPAARVGLEGLS